MADGRNWKQLLSGSEDWSSALLCERMWKFLHVCTKLWNSSMVDSSCTTLLTSWANCRPDKSINRSYWSAIACMHVAINRCYALYALATCQIKFKRCLIIFILLYFPNCTDHNLDKKNNLSFAQRNQLKISVINLVAIENNRIQLHCPQWENVKCSQQCVSKAHGLLIGLSLKYNLTQLTTDQYTYKIA